MNEINLAMMIVCGVSLLVIFIILMRWIYQAGQERAKEEREERIRQSEKVFFERIVMQAEACEKYKHQKDEHLQYFNGAAVRGYRCGHCGWTRIHWRDENNKWVGKVVEAK